MKVFYLLDIFHHHSLHFWNLSLYLCELVHLLWMINTVLHVLLKFRPREYAGVSSCNIDSQISEKAQPRELPEIFVQAFCLSSSSFSTPESLVKIVFHSLQESHWNLPSNRLNCNYTVSCKIKNMGVSQVIAST